MNGFGQRLRTLRKEKKMTQQQVADRLCLHRTSYTKYEKDESEPSLETVCKLAAMFSVSLDALLLQNEGGIVDAVPSIIPTETPKTALPPHSPTATERRTAAREAGARPRRAARRRSGR